MQKILKQDSVVPRLNSLQGSPPSGMGDLSRFWLSCLGLFVFLLPKTFKLFGFQIFWLERTWWRLFQKRVLRTKFDIYVFITNNLLSVTLQIGCKFTVQARTKYKNGEQALR